MAIVKFIVSGCPMNNIFPYVMNESKTENGILVSGIHCTPESALDEFRFVKNKFGKTDGRQYDGACYYRITRCPICAYTKKLDVSELMPLFCELDEVMITLQHGVLHRKQTLANGGEYCDYFITGNKE